MPHLKEGMITHSVVQAKSPGILLYFSAPHANPLHYSAPTLRISLFHAWLPLLPQFKFSLMSSVLSASLLVSLSLVAQVLLPQGARLPSQQAGQTVSFLQILGDSLLPTG